MRTISFMCAAVAGAEPRAERNVATVVPTGDANAALVRQRGSGNDLSLRQLNGGNSACLVQNGRDLEIDVTQTGGESVSLMQNRGGTHALPAHACRAVAGVRRSTLAPAA